MGPEVLISEDKIKQKVTDIAKKISKEYTDVTLVCVLKGGAVFFSDLMREISRLGISVYSEFVQASSYAGTRSGKLELSKIPDVRGKDIIIVEDIVETGKTLSLLRTKIVEGGARSVKTCAFLNKEKRKVEIEPDFFGFLIPDIFVIGYGLDYNEKFRGLSYIGRFDDKLLY